MSKHTKAEARRWLDAHVGDTLDTVQVRRDVTTNEPTNEWRPGPRTLVRRNKRQFAMVNDEHRASSVSDFTGPVVIVTVTDTELSFYDGDFNHTTTYTVVT